ncbi:MAG: adenylate/guanylate cyclase domain-containing protein [Rhizobiaceae bacterium]
MSHQALIRPVRDWLIEQALGNPDIVSLYQNLCERLVAIGLPITRGRLIWQTLHPLFRAETVVWDRNEQARLEHFEHQDNATDAWLNSPLRHVMVNDIGTLRRRLTGPNETLDFPILVELKEKGVTDYLVIASRIEHAIVTGDPNLMGPRGIIVTWACTRPEGFSQDDLEALQQIQKIFALACKTVIQSAISANIATTYLGSRAAANVLRGQIRRGDGATTRAVVWFSDLRNSTAYAESMTSEDYFSLLNAYFEATAGPLVEHGGEVLDFIGDAVLGIFPFEDERELAEAAGRAHGALDEVLRRSREANAERAAAGLERFRFGVGLNAGDVKFGNIGIPQRLSFSVIGHTVNEVARIESMTKLLQQPVLSASGLASLDAKRWRSVGRHKLDGVLDPVELFSYHQAA